tara:strand:+ start:1763 stop:2494 length:732 start_codon:yes stop_codon:yes gene_type:complete
MKRRNLFLFGVLAMIVAMPSFFNGLQAAELWNSTSKTNKSNTEPDARPKYYNTPTGVNGKDAPTLYNKTGKSKTSYSVSSGLKEVISRYTKASYTNFVSTPLFSLMSPNAVQNRNSDIAQALINQAETQKSVAKSMATFYQEHDKMVQKNKAEYAAKILAKNEQREEDKRARLARQEWAYQQALEGKDYNYKDYDAGAVSSSAYTSSSLPLGASSTATDIESHNGRGTRESTIGGGTKLYNSR